MNSDREVWRTAWELVSEHGEQAPVEAGLRAFELLEEGKAEACGTWQRIMLRTEELLKLGPFEAGRAH